MKKLLQHIPFFLLLLPVFFVFHGYVEHFGFIQGKYCLKLLGLYLLEATVLYGLFCAIYREPVRPAFLAAYLLFINFSFGYVQDLLIAHLPALNRYRIMLSFFLLLGVLLVLGLGRRKNPKKFTRPIFFLNILLLAWLLADGVLLITAINHPRTRGLFVKASPYRDGVSPGQPDGIPAFTARPARPGKDPDIYFLILDEYASTASLKKWYGYNNSGLDSFLLQKGFHIQYDSRSNYNYTPLCMASILNMSYLGWTGPTGICNEHDYASCEGLIRHNAVIRYLTARGYSIANYSPFDLDDQPAIVYQRVLPLKDKLIAEATFTYRLTNELGWNHYEQLPFLQRYLHHIPYETLENNQVLMESVETESRQPHATPVFAYTHLQMPHDPYIYTAAGRLKSPNEMPVHGFRETLAAYTDYLPYTNDKLKKLIDGIQQNTKNQAVIVVMGDHGFRNEIPGEGHVNFFQNLNAIYFPDKDYRLLYDSISGVNQFRVLFNKFFGQQLPMLKDSMSYTID